MVCVHVRRHFLMLCNMLTWTGFRLTWEETVLNVGFGHIHLVYFRFSYLATCASALSLFMLCPYFRRFCFLLILHSGRYHHMDSKSADSDSIRTVCSLPRRKESLGVVMFCRSRTSLQIQPLAIALRTTTLTASMTSTTLSY